MFGCKASAIMRNLQDFKQHLQIFPKRKHSWHTDNLNAVPYQEITTSHGNTILNKSKKSIKPHGYWDSKNNILQFIEEIKNKFNLQNFDDWNSITKKKIQSHPGGSTLLNKYSVFDIKCFGFPSGKLQFTKSKLSKPSKYWENKNNIYQFLNELKEKLNLQTFNDWNSITTNNIQSLPGGSRLLQKYSLYELKCFGFPDGKLSFSKSNPSKPIGYWDKKDNVIDFLNELKEKLNLQTFDDWNSMTVKQIKSNGGSRLFHKYSLFELKCFGFPEGKSYFTRSIQYKSSEYWENEQNREQFLENLKLKFNLKTPQDWKRISAKQIKLQGGNWLFKNNLDLMNKSKVFFEVSDVKNHKTNVSYTVKELLDLNKNKISRRSSQRWLFLLVQKLFPGEEIVEDYFHSDISRETGLPVQFDIFLLKSNIAIEYHGQQHFEDIPNAFAPLEMHINRDLEKESLCNKYGVKLIIIPYWWDNKLDSLRTTLFSQLNKPEPLL